MRRKDGGWTKLCIWIVKDLLWQTKKKKDGFDWIVDLKVSKILKGKWDKNDGFCQVVYLKCKRLAKKKREKKKRLAKLWIWN